MNMTTQEMISIEGQAAHLWNEYLQVADFSNDQPSKSDGNFWPNYTGLIDFSQNHRIDLSSDKALISKGLQQFAATFRNKFQCFKELVSLFLLLARFFVLVFLAISIIMYTFGEDVVQMWQLLFPMFILVFAVILGAMVLITLIGLTVEWVRSVVKVEKQGLCFNTKLIRWDEIQNIQLMNTRLSKMKIHTHDHRVFQYPINFRRKKHQQFVELLQKQVGKKLVLSQD